MDEIEASHFIATLRFVAADVLLGVRDSWVNIDTCRISANWQCDQACAGSEEAKVMAQRITWLAGELEVAGAHGITLLQTNDAILVDGRWQLTGRRSLIASWKWGV